MKTANSSGNTITNDSFISGTGSNNIEITTRNNWIILCRLYLYHNNNRDNNGNNDYYINKKKITDDISKWW